MARGSNRRRAGTLARAAAAIGNIGRAIADRTINRTPGVSQDVQNSATPGRYRAGSGSPRLTTASAVNTAVAAARSGRATIPNVNAGGDGSAYPEDV